MDGGRGNGGSFLRQKASSSRTSVNTRGSFHSRARDVKKRGRVGWRVGEADEAREEDNIRETHVLFFLFAVFCCVEQKKIGSKANNVASKVGRMRQSAQPWPRVVVSSLLLCCFFVVLLGGSRCCLTRKLRAASFFCLFALFSSLFFCCSIGSIKGEETTGDR